METGLDLRAKGQTEGARVCAERHKHYRTDCKSQQAARPYLQSRISVREQFGVLRRKQYQLFYACSLLELLVFRALCTGFPLITEIFLDKKEENMQQAREEEESRKKATSHFQLTLNEIQAQLEQHDIHNAKLRQENIELGEKLKKLIEQYTLREEHIDKVFKRKELQQQLGDAKLQQTTQLIKEADEKHLREREFLLKEATESRYKYEEMKHQEVQLKQQLSLYIDKFEEFQTTMAKSNELFITFRQEMEKMTEKIKKLEKEMMIWRTKWESNNKVLLQMAEEKTIRDKEYNASQMKLERLEKLFRALQMERNELNEKVEVLKEQVSVKAADVDFATAMIQPCTTVSLKGLNTSFKRAPEIFLQGETKAANETKHSSNNPSDMISSGH
ncbi:gamma-taxilin-like [Molossus nigricans]